MPSVDLSAWTYSYMSDFASFFLMPQYRSTVVQSTLNKISQVLVNRDYFESEEIPVEHALFVYALAFYQPYCTQVGITPPNEWVTANYTRFKPVLDKYSNGQTSLPDSPEPDPCPVGLQVTSVIATVSGAQTIVLPERANSFLLMVNGVFRLATGVTVDTDGLTYTVDSSYGITSGDVVALVWLPAFEPGVGCGPCDGEDEPTVVPQGIADHSITLIKLVTDLGLPTSYLQDAAEFFLRNGSVVATGNFDLGGFRITNVGDPSAPTDAVNLRTAENLIGAAISSGMVSGPVQYARFAFNANVPTLSGRQDGDGVTGVLGDTVLLPLQADMTQNGLWVMNSGAWTRPLVYGSGSTVPPMLILVKEGTENADSQWQCLTNGIITVDTSSTLWRKNNIDAPVDIDMGVFPNAEQFTNDESLTIYKCQAVYVVGDRRMRLARANTLTSSYIIGLVADTTVGQGAVGSAILADVFEATTMQWDAVTGQAGGLVPDARYYLSLASYGGMSVNPPNSGFFCEIGTALSPTIMNLRIGMVVRL